MKLRKLVASMVAGASMLAMAGMVVADEPNVDINIYGSSAQYNYWSAAAPNFLMGAPDNCTTVNYYTTASSGALFGLGNSNVIAIGTGCTGVTGGTKIIRATSKSSQDGVNVMRGNIQYAGSEQCQPGDTGYPTSDNPNFYRRLADEATVAGGTPATKTPPAAGTAGTVSGYKCVKVILGCADVANSSITEATAGCLYGNNDTKNNTSPNTCDHVNQTGTNWISRDFTGGIPFPTGATEYKSSLVIPMGFFVNKSVKRCSSTATGAAADWNTNCPGGVANTGYQATIFNNMPRMKAVVIFTQQVFNWSDVGQDFAPQNIVVCHRHAGSGTLATLDIAVINANGYTSALLPSIENPPYLYFNDGTGDELWCVDNNAGAVGYADGDNMKQAGQNCTNNPGGCASSPARPNTAAVMYQGEWPTAANTRNCEYDFYSNQHCYYLPDSTHGAEVTALFNFAASPTSIPSSVSTWYTSQNAMQCEKAIDLAYPGFVGPASERQDP